jgi:hypothetical protein
MTVGESCQVDGKKKLLKKNRAIQAVIRDITERKRNEKKSRIFSKGRGSIKGNLSSS